MKLLLSLSLILLASSDGYCFVKSNSEAVSKAKKSRNLFKKYGVNLGYQGDISAKSTMNNPSLNFSVLIAQNRQCNIRYIEWYELRQFHRVIAFTDPLDSGNFESCLLDSRYPDYNVPMNQIRLHPDDPQGVRETAYSECAKAYGISIENLKEVIKKIAKYYGLDPNNY